LIRGGQKLPIKETTSKENPNPANRPLSSLEVQSTGQTHVSETAALPPL